MVSAAGERPLIEMGSRRTHERAAVAAARAAYIAGFAATSNLEAQRHYGIPTEGTAAHAFTMLHTRKDGPPKSGAGRVPRPGRRAGHRHHAAGGHLRRDDRRGQCRGRRAAPTLGAVRIDSGELGVLARQVREQLDRLGATQTRIVVSGDLDEFSIAALRAEPVDSYGVGTSLVTGSGAPAAGMVYKLVEVDGMPVQKRSSHKESAAAARRRCGCHGRPARSPRRWCIRRAVRPPPPNRAGC